MSKYLYENIGHLLLLELAKQYNKLGRLGLVKMRPKSMQKFCNHFLPFSKCTDMIGVGDLIHATPTEKFLLAATINELFAITV